MEKPSVRKFIGCVIGFAGVILINLTGTSIGSLNLKGDGFILLYTIMNGFAAVLIKKYSEKEEPVVLTGYQFLFGGVVLIVAGLLGHGRLLPESFSAWLLMAYMVFLSAVAYTLWSVLLKFNDVSRVTVYNFSNPVFAVLLSALILREQNSFTAFQCIASLFLVCLGILIVNLRGG